MLFEAHFCLSALQMCTAITTADSVFANVAKEPFTGPRQRKRVMYNTAASLYVDCEIVDRMVHDTSVS